MTKLIDHNQGLSLLLSSEILKIEKKNEELKSVHEKMIKNKATETLGYKGLMELNLKNQDYHHAFIYGEKLFQLNPNIEKIYPTLVNIIAMSKNWHQLILITKKSYTKKIIDSETFSSNTAIAYFEISKIKMHSEINESLKLILKALKLKKSFPPLVKQHLVILLKIGDRTQLIKIIRKYWLDSPNSSLRKIISPFLKENKLDDIKTINSIIKNNYNKIESKKLIMEFAILNSNWSLARENTIGLIDKNPDREICELMALLELGEFNDKQKSDAWNLRAQNSKFNEIWICNISSVSQNNWSSVSDGGFFNSLEWRQPKMLSTNIIN